MFFFTCCSNQVKPAEKTPEDILCDFNSLWPKLEKKISASLVEPTKLFDSLKTKVETEKNKDNLGKLIAEISKFQDDIENLIQLCYRAQNLCDAFRNLAYLSPNKTELLTQHTSMLETLRTHCKNPINKLREQIESLLKNAKKKYDSLASLKDVTPTLSM